MFTHREHLHSVSRLVLRSDAPLALSGLGAQQGGRRQAARRSTSQQEPRQLPWVPVHRATELIPVTTELLKVLECAAGIAKAAKPIGRPRRNQQPVMAAGTG